MMRINSVSRAYGERIAVRDLTLDVENGEVFAFLGPNGAGKTTTIKMLVGLLWPTSGSISICGYDVVQQAQAAKRQVGYVPDQPELYDKLSGREFLQFVCDMHGMPKSVAATAIDLQAHQFGLVEFWDQLTEDYSHGMKQRVVFAAALVHDPAVIILDEPMVGLDPKSMREVKDLLRRRASAGGTVFMSTHTLAVAEEIADRIAVIHQGTLLFLGTVDELKGRLSQADSTLEELFLTLTSQPS